MERILASERRREKLRALMDGRNEVENGCSELARLAARLIIEEALEGETRDALGREYYARGAVPGAGYRKGYRKGCVSSAEGGYRVRAPQIADRAEPFRSRLREVVRVRGRRDPEPSDANPAPRALSGGAALPYHSGRRDVAGPHQHQQRRYD
jgi:hypothetical protein